MGSQLTVTDGLAVLSAGFDAWGKPGPSVPLMKRVKERFDPHNILNPGRFVGGI
jgi:glycolate oxidase FAD binding subunit